MIMQASADKAAFAAFLAPWAEAEWVVYAKEPFGGPEEVLRLSLTLHASRRHLEPPARLGRRRRRHVQMQGLSDRWTGPVHDDDACTRTSSSGGS